MEALAGFNKVKELKKDVHGKAAHADTPWVITIS